VSQHTTAEIGGAPSGAHSLCPAHAHRRPQTGDQLPSRAPPTAFTMPVMPWQSAVAAVPGGVETLPFGAILHGVKRKLLALSAMIGAPRSNRYFLRPMKQTTGIATINIRQLRAFSALVPPLRVQERYSDLVKGKKGLDECLAEAEAVANEMLGSVAQRVFQGEL